MFSLRCPEFNIKVHSFIILRDSVFNFKCLAIFGH